MAAESFPAGVCIVARDYLSTDKSYFQARVWDRDSDWSPVIEVPPGVTGVVLRAPREVTGMGRRWHKVLLNMPGGHGRIGWIDGPGSWDKVANGEKTEGGDR